MRTEIGKIRSISFGHGGYQDAMIGVTFDLGGKSWGVGDFWGDWALERCTNTQWTEQDRITKLGKTVMRINQLLKDANVSTLEKLVGKPVEVTFDGNLLETWRILTEAI